MIVQNELTETEKLKITDEISTIAYNFLNADSLNLESHISLRANVEGYVMGSDGKILYTDFNAYREGITQLFENIEGFTTLKCVKIYVYVLASDAASCTTEFEGKVLTNHGETFIHNGCWTFVFKKFENGWKVVHENGTHIHE
jgi:hypothetical protein